MIRSVYTLTIILLTLNVLRAQITFTYLGENKVKNVLIQEPGIEDETETLFLKKGQILKSNDPNVSDFVIMKDYELFYGAGETLHSKIISLALKDIPLPDSGHVFSYSSYLTVDSIRLQTLKEINKKKKFGDRAQIDFWNQTLGLKEPYQGSEVYSWQKSFIYDSRSEGKVMLLGYVNETLVDTLFQKNVLIGSYLVKTNKITTGTVKGKIHYELSDSFGNRAVDDPSRINQDSIYLSIPFSHNLDKLYIGSSLHLYDSDENLVKTYYEKKTLQKGQYFERLKYNYFGFGDESFKAVLKSKKGETIYEMKANFNDLQAKKKLNRGTPAYIQMEQKYTSKRAEQRVKSTVENEEGEVLAIVFNSKNIHTGVNKINYTFKHKLPEGSEVYLIVKTKQGKVLLKELYRVK